MINISEKASSSEPLFQALRDRIISGEYPPGTLLVEKELTKEFTISRTPYREALRQLESMKLIKVVPRFGTYVSEIDINEILNAYEVRLRLESMAAELSAERRTDNDILELKETIDFFKDLSRKEKISKGGRIDENLHSLISKFSKNTILIETVYNLRVICARIWTTSWREMYNFERFLYDWQEIYSAIINKDKIKSSKIMKIHIEDSINIIKKNYFER